MTRPPKEVHEARARVRRLLEREAGFVGTGIAPAGSGYEVLVLVEDGDCPAAKKAPRDWQGVRIRVEATGIPRAHGHGP